VGSPTNYLTATDAKVLGDKKNSKKLSTMKCSVHFHKENATAAIPITSCISQWHSYKL